MDDVKPEALEKISRCPLTTDNSNLKQNEVLRYGSASTREAEVVIFPLNPP
jgi:hypothetical protein